jgi:adenosylcobinamide-phosphate synthase
MYNILATTIACVLDASFGYPDPVYKKIKHPVDWLSAVIAWLEKNFNSENPSKAKNMGILSMLYLLFITFTISYAIAYYGGFIGQVIGIAVLLGGRKPYQDINDIYHELKNGNVEASRIKLASITNLNPANSSETQICASAIKTLAAGFKDNVVAPIFWALLFGLPGIACYKAIHTANVLITPENPRYKYFGQAPAALNDVVDFIPARLSFMIIYFVGSQPINNIGKAAKEAGKNANSYPQTAIAMALGINLNDSIAGEVQLVSINDIERALNLFLRCCFISFIIMLSAAVLLPS